LYVRIRLLMKHFTYMWFIWGNKCLLIIIKLCKLLTWPSLADIIGFFHHN
jgi:hypothetical protein